MRWLVKKPSCSLESYLTKTQVNVVEWLTVHPTKFESSFITEYRVQRPLLAASAVFDHRVQSLENGTGLLVLAEANLRIPFKGKLSFKAQTESGASASEVQFLKYVEFDENKNLTRQWKAFEDILILEQGMMTEGLTPKKTKKIPRNVAPVLNPLLLSAALASVESTLKPLMCNLVAGTSIVGLSLQQARVQSLESICIYEGRFGPVPDLLTKSQMVEGHWQPAHRFTLVWNLLSKSIQRISAPIPMFGEVAFEQTSV